MKKYLVPAIGLVAMFSLSAASCDPIKRVTPIKRNPAPVVATPTIEVTPVETLTSPGLVTLAEPIVGSDPPITECTLATEVFTADPWPMCIPDPCLAGERWVAGVCVVD